MILIFTQVYFCRFIIDPVLKDVELKKYINADVLEKYWEVGGVRIEDNIHITKDGYENLTTAPKTADQIELMINGS
jgi:Xaa-Pro dipeptidase